MFDIGVNLTSSQFANDRTQVIARAKAARVSGMLLTGTSVHESEQALALVQVYPDYCWSMAGVHPHDASQWTESAAELDDCLQAGMLIGITGWVCDERRDLALRHLLPRIPGERLLLETDAPYLLPRDLQPKPASRRNEPCFLAHIVRQVAAWRDEDASQLGQKVDENARRVFRLA